MKVNKEKNGTQALLSVIINLISSGTEQCHSARYRLGYEQMGHKQHANLERMSVVSGHG